MNKTETLHCRQEVPNELLDREPSFVNHIAEKMHTELGKMLADKICDGKVYRVLMEKPHIEIGDVGFNKNTSVYRSKISVTPIVMCQDCKYWVSDGGALMICDIHKTQQYHTTIAVMEKRTKMNDPIRREDVIATIGLMYERCDTYDITDYRDLMLEAVKVLPSADRPQGEWIDKGWKGDWQFETDGRGNCWHEYECSECGFHSKGSKSKYCPHCGAQMKGADDE